MNVNNDILLGVGHISVDAELGAYYQDSTAAIYHYEHESLGGFDEEGVPYVNRGKQKFYRTANIIQYGLIAHDLIIKNIDVEVNKKRFLTSVTWLHNKLEPFHDALIIRNEDNKQYGLAKGWVSGMYQGQLLSIFLRAYQMYADPKYLESCHKIYEYFKYDYTEGGVKRIDENGCIWFEEYPTSTPSYVLNGYIYCMFGILDYYRVTQKSEAKKLFDDCVHTLEVNLYKYHVWYWSVYDQLKKQLLSYYYQKNVHVPLMQIMFLITNKEIFNNFAKKWEASLKSPVCNILVKIMYRVQPRLHKLSNYGKKI